MRQVQLRIWLEVEVVVEVVMTIRVSGDTTSSLASYIAGATGLLVHVALSDGCSLIPGRAAKSVARRPSDVLSVASIPRPDNSTGPGSKGVLVDFRVGCPPNATDDSHFPAEVPVDADIPVYSGRVDDS